jgi:hypothetical protein
VPFVYLIVREDLSLAQQVVQASHAAVEAARHLIPPDLIHPHIIVCAAGDEPALWRQLHRLQRHGVRFRAFFEPDRGNELTAVATEPVFGQTRRLFRNLRLLTPEQQPASSKGGEP